MCGIVGFVGKGDPAVLTQMTEALFHRGPDESGYFLDSENAVYLGHRRLSIIDLKSGQQPMWNPDETIGVIFNGEIYNHKELRQTLKDLGYSFQTDHSDTEVLIYAYQRWGENCPKYLNGMFAFAIYDKITQSLFLARDHFGKKPLYYVHQPHQVFAFSSELSALRLHPYCPQNINALAIKKFLAYGFLPAPHTFYHSIFKLESGSGLRFDLKTEKITRNFYWQFRVEPDLTLNRRSENDLADELHALLAQAVKRRLISDVPLGLFLSGGIDSSSVAALATEQLHGSPMQTFAIGFTEPSYDESAYARHMAAAIQSEHHEKMITIDDCRASLFDILRRWDEPLGDPSILPTYLLSQFARNHVKVALSGDGGDELFAGYDPFKALTPAALYNALIGKKINRIIKKGIERLPPLNHNMSFDFKLRKTLTGLNYSPSLWNPIWLGAADPELLQAISREKIDVEEIYSEAITLWENSSLKEIGDKTLEFYTRLYLQNNILPKVDKASMLASLEVRSPFLDRDLVEFARKLPYSLKHRGNTQKYLLKKAMARHLPADIIKRKKKGFGIPVAQWLREIPKNIPAKSLPHINTESAVRYWEAHRSKKRDYRQFLWCWLALQTYFYPQESEA